ncbi:MAG: hypothetical protein ABI923_08455 [bacterium]
MQRIGNSSLSLCRVALITEDSDPNIDPEIWESGRYCPTPTIIEAALALYKGHSVREISRNDAKAMNLSVTSDAIAEVISSSKEKSHSSG